MNIDVNKLVPEAVISGYSLDLANDIRRDVLAEATASEVAAYVKGWVAHRRRVTPPPYTREEQRLEILCRMADGEAKEAAHNALSAYRRDRDARWLRGDSFYDEPQAIDFHEAIFGPVKKNP